MLVNKGLKIVLGSDKQEGPHGPHVGLPLVIKFAGNKPFGRF